MLALCYVTLQIGPESNVMALWCHPDLIGTKARFWLSQILSPWPLLLSTWIRWLFKQATASSWNPFSESIVNWMLNLSSPKVCRILHVYNVVYNLIFLMSLISSTDQIKQQAQRIFTDDTIRWCLEIKIDKRINNDGWKMFWCDSKLAYSVSLAFQCQWHSPISQATVDQTEVKRVVSMSHIYPNKRRCLRT